MMRVLGTIALIWTAASVSAAACWSLLFRLLGECEPLPAHGEDDATWLAGVPVDCLRDGDPEIARRFVELTAGLR